MKLELFVLPKVMNNDYFRETRLTIVGVGKMFPSSFLGSVAGLIIKST